MGETYYEDIIEALKKENKALKKRCEQLERSNEGLCKLSLLLAAEIPQNRDLIYLHNSTALMMTRLVETEELSKLDHLGKEWCNCNCYDMNKKG